MAFSAPSPTPAPALVVIRGTKREARARRIAQVARLMMRWRVSSATEGESVEPQHVIPILEGWVRVLQREAATRQR
jgi:hypothetical protein